MMWLAAALLALQQQVGIDKVVLRLVNDLRRLPIHVGERRRLKDVQQIITIVQHIKVSRVDRHLLWFPKVSQYKARAIAL